MVGSFAMYAVGRYRRTSGLSRQSSVRRISLCPHERRLDQHSSRVGGERAGFVVDLAARQCGIEDADQPQVGLHPHDMAVVGVQRVHRAGHDRVALAGGQVLDLTLALDAVAGLEMVGVLHLLLPAGLDNGVVQREAHGVALQQEAAAAPAVAGHVALGADHLVKGANDHAAPPSVHGTSVVIPARKGSPAGCGIIGFHERLPRPCRHTPLRQRCSTPCSRT